MKFLSFFRRSVLLSADCRLFTISVSIFIMALTIIFSYTWYSSHLKENHQKLILAANSIDIVLNESLNEVRKLMFYIGKEIAAHKNEDIKFITNILLNNHETLCKHKGIISGTMFGWINKKNLTTISSVHDDGKSWINNKLIDVSHRSYVSTCLQYPWTIQVSRPEIGLTSGLWIIPVALGVTNLKGEYLGALMTGLEVFKLSNKIQQILNPNIDFIILDNNLKIIVQSINNSIDPKSSYYRDLLEGINFFNLRTSFLKKPIKYKDIEYSFYKKMSDYPYVILTGFKTHFIYSNFLTEAGFYILELWGIGLFCLALLYFFRKKLLNISLICEKDRDLFLKQVQQETHKPIISIIKNCESLLSYFKKKETDIYINHKPIKLIGLISEAASCLSKTTLSNLNLTFFDVNQTIKECLNIHRNTAIMKEISIETDYGQDLPPLYADGLRFKQMILGLIALAIETNTPRGSIKISTLSMSNEGQKYLTLIVEDNGIGFDIDDIKRIRGMLNINNNHFTGMDISSIEQLVSIHKGTFRLDATLPRGKKFTITLPYNAENKTFEAQETHNFGDNVLIFPRSADIH